MYNVSLNTIEPNSSLEPDKEAQYDMLSSLVARCRSNVDGAHALNSEHSLAIVCGCRGENVMNRWER